jgi:hypothetical protein
LTHVRLASDAQSINEFRGRGFLPVVQADVLARSTGIFTNDEPTAFDAGCFQKPMGFPVYSSERSLLPAEGPDWPDPLRAACTFCTSETLEPDRLNLRTIRSPSRLLGFFFGADEAVLKKE